MAITALDALVDEWFLARYGTGEVMRKVYDPGTGHAAQVAELEANRRRLRQDRQAGCTTLPKMRNDTALNTGGSGRRSRRRKRCPSASRACAWCPPAAP